MDKRINQVPMPPENMRSESLKVQTKGNYFMSEHDHKADPQYRGMIQQPACQYDKDIWHTEDKKGYQQLTKAIKENLSKWKNKFKRNYLLVPKKKMYQTKCTGLYHHIEQLNRMCVQWQAHLTGNRVQHQPPVSDSEGQRAVQTTKDDKDITTTSLQVSDSGQRQQVGTAQTETESNCNSSSKDLQVEQIDELKSLLEQERKKYTESKEERQNMQDELKDIQQNCKIHTDKLIEMEQRIRMLKIEKEEALNRLSEMAGKKLLDNNPGIADLSTLIRPTKIAEMIKECYDNEWTDAFEELSDTGVPEKEIIQQLLKHFQDASRFCESLTEKFCTGLAGYIFNFPEKTDSLGHQNTALSKEGSDVIKQLQKATSTHVYRRLQDVFVADCRQKSAKPLGQNLETYVRKCVELTWYMCVQSPQMAIYCDMEEGDLFDNEKFSMYTQTGDFVDYLVWPCILLHRNGPLLSKGVAQARRTRKRTPEIAASGENAEVQRAPDDCSTMRPEQIMLIQEMEKNQEIQSKMLKSVNETSAGQKSENSDIRNLSNDTSSNKTTPQKTVIRVTKSTSTSTNKNETATVYSQTKM